MDFCDEHRRIFLAKVLLGEKAVHRRHDVGQRHARNQMRVHHSLQGGRQHGRGHTLAADVGQHHGQSIFGVHHVEKVATNFFAGQIPAAHFRKRHFRDGHGHQSLLNRCRDRKFLLIAPRDFFRLYEPRVFNQRRRIGRDHAQNVVTYARNVSRGES